MRWPLGRVSRSSVFGDRVESGARLPQQPDDSEPNGSPSKSIDCAKVLRRWNIKREDGMTDEQTNEWLEVCVMTEPETAEAVSEG